MRKTILLFILLLYLAAAGCTMVDDTNIDTNDQAQIYAAAIREIHTIERARDQVYVVTTTEDYTILTRRRHPRSTFKKIFNKR
jgi:DNA-binding LytR/AlgR family response regulator